MTCSRSCVAGNVFSQGFSLDVGEEKCTRAWLKLSLVMNCKLGRYALELASCAHGFDWRLPLSGSAQCRSTDCVTKGISL